jgi:uncharacterized membrane protein YgcG
MKPTRLFKRPDICLAFVLVLLSAFLLASPALAGRDQFQVPPVTYLHYNVDMTLKPDGNFIVLEIQEIRFNDSFQTAFAEIPLDYVTNVSTIRLWEGATPYVLKDRASEAGTYAIEVGRSSIFVEWRFAETAPGDVRTFVLGYVVQGGLWVYADETILEWRAVPADRSGAPVLASQVTIHLPDGTRTPVDQLRYTAYGPEFTVQAAEDQVTFVSSAAIPDGTRFQVQLGFPPELTAATLQAWQIKEETAQLAYRLEAMDVDLALDGDGQVRVTERQRVAVDAGAMYSGQRAISLAYMDGIRDIQLFEGEQPFSPAGPACETYCFQTKQPSQQRAWITYDEKARAVNIDEWKAGEAAIEWDFPGLVKGEASTFHLQYTALGAIQVNEASQQLNWTVVYAKRDVPVQAASLRIELPPGVRWQDVTLQGGEMQVQADGSIRLVHEGEIRPGRTWQIKLTMPAGATAASQPAWQATLEAAAEQARRAQVRLARAQVAVALAGTLILVAGGLAALLSWQVWGRDRPVDRAAEYVSQPPSALPPGLVAYLVDERPTAHGVLASLFHLASLGLLRVDMSGEQLHLQRNWRDELSPGQSLYTPSGEMVTVPDHLVVLFNSLRPAIPASVTTSLSRILSDFNKALPGVYAELAAEADHFFTESPAVARRRWVSIGQWLLLAGLAGTAGAWFLFVADLGLVALAPGAALVAVGLAFLLISRWMPQKTAAGSQEAAQWRAFQAYLRRLKSYAGLAEAQRLLDEYFAYAVALDVADVVLAQAEELGAQMPVWTYSLRLEFAGQAAEPALPAGPAATPVEEAPRPIRVVRDRPAEGGRETAPEASPPRLSLQGLSRQLGRQLSSASSEIGRILNSAAGAPGADTPFKMILKRADRAVDMSWDAATSTSEVIGDIMKQSSAGGGSGSYSHRSSRLRSTSSTRWSSRSSRGFSGRSSGSRRSGGGGRRGFR